MRRKFVLTLGVLCSPSLGLGQQAAPPDMAPPPAAQSVYYAGPGVIAPELLSLDVSVSLPKPCIGLDGMVRLSAVVDAHGVARDVKTLQSDDARLGTIAVSLLSTARFKPGAHMGDPVTTTIEATVGLQTCLIHIKKAKNRNGDTPTLRSHPLIGISLASAPAVTASVSNISSAEGSLPLARMSTPELSKSAIAPNPLVAPESMGTPFQVGGHISAPIPIYRPDPEYSDFAKRKKIKGSCLLGVVIDVNGVPQSLRVVKSLERSLDQSAVEAVKTWRFRPALKDGKIPVPVEVAIEANFAMYKGVPIAFAAMAAESPEEVLAAVSGGAKDRITQPVPLNTNDLDPEYSYYGRMHRIKGVCILALVVGIDGVPQNVRVIKPLERGMDEDAVAAAQQLRFKPALKDGVTTVPAEMIIPITFRFKISKHELFEKILTAAIFVWAL